jgi:hypothetical protein
MCRHDLSGIPFAVTLADVHVNRCVWKESEPHAILLRDKPAEVFVINPPRTRKELRIIAPAEVPPMTPPFL